MPLQAAPADAGWARPGAGLGPSDPEVRPGRKAPAALPWGTGCLRMWPAASQPGRPCQRVAHSQGRPGLPSTHALWPCKAKSHGLACTRTAVQADQMSQHRARQGLTAAVPSECPLIASICSNHENPSALCTHALMARTQSPEGRGELN